jgi:Zn finger protein HypA/HybF involved in hydrogenase expression
MEYRKQFHCKECSHTFEKIVLEAVVSAVCPKCRQLVGLLKFAQEQGLTFGQTVVVGLIIYAIFG